MDIPFDDQEVQRIEHTVENFLQRRRPPPRIRPQLDLGYRMMGHSIELFEIRPQWDNPKQIHRYSFAKASWVKAKRQWKIYWKNDDLKWHGYEPVATVKSIDDFVAIVDADPHGCFFG